MLGVTFVTYQICDIQKARELLIYCVDHYIKIINEHPEIEKYSRDFPYTDKNISNSILFFDKNKNMYIESRPPAPPLIASAQADEGQLTYWIDPNDLLELQHQETYEEAIRAIQDDTSL